MAMTAEECRGAASYCEERAAGARDEGVKSCYRQMAQTWLELASRIEKLAASAAANTAQ